MRSISNVEEEKDRCMVCGVETSYTKDTPVEERFCYVEGAGQLCGKCWEKIYEDPYPRD